MLLPDLKRNIDQKFGFLYLDQMLSFILCSFWRPTGGVCSHALRA